MGREVKMKGWGWGGVGTETVELDKNNDKNIAFRKTSNP